MANLVRLPRVVDGENPHPGCWSRWDKSVIICCPKCEQNSVLDHEIDDDGTVRPSVVHPCGWHEFVQLVGWSVDCVAGE